MTTRILGALRIARPRATGSALIFALILMLVLAVAGIAIVRLAGNDRIEAAAMGQHDRGLACAEAGLQYARRFFGTRYDNTTGSNGWNYWLSHRSAGYRFDEKAGDRLGDGTMPALANLPLQVRGASDGAHLDAGADLDGDGQPDFWVSIHDDEDEVSEGVAANDPSHDNNETVIIRSECTNPAFGLVRGGQTDPVHVVLEGVLSHIQGGSGYGVSGPSNSADLVGR